jgi:hypothetical protein
VLPLVDWIFLVCCCGELIAGGRLCFSLYWFASVLPPHVSFGGVILRRHSLLVFIGEELACLDHFSLIFYLLPAMGLD